MGPGRDPHMDEGGYDPLDDTPGFEEQDEAELAEENDGNEEEETGIDYHTDPPQHIEDIEGDQRETPARDEDNDERPPRRRRERSGRPSKAVNLRRMPPKWREKFPDAVAITITLKNGKLLIFARG